MASPVGESSWIDYVDQQRREASDLDTSVALLERFRQAVSAEPGSLKLWIAYCEYFWSLYAESHNGAAADSLGWSPEEVELGRQVFTLDAGLNLWKEGYEAVQYRLGDSHKLWDLWIAHEMELLARTRTEQGVIRITQLFKHRLVVPHAAWDATAQNFSSFLSQYNPNAYEAEMQEVTKNAKDAKKTYALRDAWEMKLKKAAKAENAEAAVKQVLTDYLLWEILHTKKDGKHALVSLKICLGLFSRALTGPLAEDEDTWENFLVFVGSAHSDIKAGRNKLPGVAQIVPNMLDVHQRAVRHVPWSGTLWARYILSAEEAGLPFADIERIKHAATNSPQIDKDGMMSVLEMYTAWCGYLKRTAMNPNAVEESIDLAEVGLPAALEDVKHWGRRRYGDAYQGDPNFRLEKILIQFLMEKKDNIDAARAVWTELSGIQLHANSYDFWLHWYLWEMVVFAAAKSKARSPTPSALGQGLRVPTHATQVFQKALKVKTLDWPERVMEVFLQHCNDYELPDTLREAMDTIYKTRKGVAKRRGREAEQAAAAQAQAYAQAQAEAPAVTAEPTAAIETEPQDQPMADAEPPDEAAPNGKEDTSDLIASKRKRESTEEDDTANKRSKSEPPSENAPKRDREHAAVFISNLPAEITQTKVKHFFRDYGNIHTIDIQRPKDTPPVALIEFTSAEDARTSLIREGKKIGDSVVHVTSAEDCTLWVTNYPPDADEASLRALFEPFGPVHSIRFPSLKYNNKRRFCYVSFRIKTAAAAAVKKLHNTTPLEGARFPLQVKLSNPAARQERTGAQAELRELHVRNLRHDTHEKDVEAIFAKVGKVQRVRVVLAKGGAYQAPVSAFVDMETAEQAKEAIDKLDKQAWQGRILTVELSKPKPAPGDPNTGEVAKAEVARAAEAKDADPKEEASGGEAKDAPAAAEKAKLVAKPAGGRGFMPPPAAIRRPVLGAAGQKRGLGFLVPRKQQPVVAAGSGGGGANGAASNNENAKPKSNDDFKKLFMAAGNGNGSQGQKNDKGQGTTGNSKEEGVAKATQD